MEGIPRTLHNFATIETIKMRLGEELKHVSLSSTKEMMTSYDVFTRT